MRGTKWITIEVDEKLVHKHKAGPDLYEALKKARNYIHPDNTMILSDIDKALAQANKEV